MIDKQLLYMWLGMGFGFVLVDIINKIDFNFNSLIVGIGVLLFTYLVTIFEA